MNAAGGSGVGALKLEKSRTLGSGRVYGRESWSKCLIGNGGKGVG